MTESELIAALHNNHLAHLWGDLRSITRSTIRLHLAPDTTALSSLGSSRTGGVPDVPVDFVWPTEPKTGHPLSFIAQINLQEVTPFDEDGLLPSEGLLYFFYSAEQEAWGYDIQDAGMFRVQFYNGDGSNLRRASFPDSLADDARFTPCALVPQAEISMCFDTPIFNNLSEDEQETIFEIFNEGGPTNKMLGYADTIQGEMELECELVTNGLYCGDSSGYQDPRAKELEPNAADWRLLLQVDSNEEENEMMWGDAGRLYFWIKEQDLQARAFDKSWVILQCY
ncbi:YwqG family protein [Hymenobacter psychrotolerans]|uniref:Uncharacterized protein YwqG n=1 Tax=Hymenobacter psychrotolerans DSM 18569 TaxID=1121959 RepID=A0A1M6UMQ8_9BACT|nr:YwqG family protein [Hymenobacter psychrotolerans]SHK70380.1 Uncharacterized protein YwqG [Hymenobacter psychrotolerans DSM 18569]